MKAPSVVLGLICIVVVPAAHAQSGLLGKGNALGGPSAAPGAGAEKTDGKLFPSNAPLPEPTDAEKLQPATLVLPEDPIEPYLLSKDDGPFMVTAKTFRGPDAERYALALVLELRREFGLPAFILRTRDFPMRTVMRNVPPLAPEVVRKPRLTDPEAARSHDEAAVLVGNEKSLEGSIKLLAEVKKIKPKCLNEVRSIYHWREGLVHATRTTNPYVPTQNLFPGRRKDKLILEMNGGPHSIFHCPGRYSLQIAEFSGRAEFITNETDSKIFDSSSLKKSPLMTAMDDAEHLADVLAKDSELARAGYQPYVYHDRRSSKVMVGSFSRPDDPAAGKLRDELLTKAQRVEKDERNRKLIFSGILGRSGITIAPALSLTDLEDPTNPIKNQQ